MPAIRKLLCFVASLSLLPSLAIGAPLGSGFTYQGELIQAGTPVDGNVHLRFSLWDAAGSGAPPTGGTQIGASQVVRGVPVSHGLFSVLVNSSGEFGAQAFDGQARWLQIEVCSDSTCASTTVLAPRQAITGAPYALGPWQASGTSITYSGGNVGVGTAAPTSKLDVRGGAMAVENLGDQADLLWLNSERSWVFRQEGTGAGTALKLQSVGGGGNKHLIIQTTGLVGVGTVTPTAKLDVRGDIRLGANGEYLAPGSSENLRILRGKISSTGAIVFGSGFTAARASTGVYNLSFSPAFPSGQYPIVTASAESNGPARFAMINFPTHISASVRIVNGSGTAVDDDFYFIAVGPR